MKPAHGPGLAGALSKKRKAFNAAIKSDTLYADRQAAMQVKPAKVDLPVVIPTNVKITRAQPFVDMRFRADPGHVGPFSMVGIGRDVETGRAWG